MNNSGEKTIQVQVNHGLGTNIVRDCGYIDRLVAYVTPKILQIELRSSW